MTTDDTEIYNMIHVSQVNYHTDNHGWPRMTWRIILSHGHSRMATDDTENYIITRTITDDTENYYMISN